MNLEKRLQKLEAHFIEQPDGQWTLADWLAFYRSLPEDCPLEEQFERERQAMVAKGISEEEATRWIAVASERICEVEAIMTMFDED